MVNKQFKRDTVEDKTDKKKSINKYLEELKKIIDDKDVKLSDTMREKRGLDVEINKIFRSIYKKLNNAEKINKNEIKSIEKFFKKHATGILTDLKIIINNNLDCE